MHTEFEAKFVQVSLDEVRARLGNAGATCTSPMRSMRRAIIETAEMKAKGAFLRIRDQGDRVVVTYKQFAALSVDGATELELEVASFEAAVELFSGIGLAYRSYQESRRESWSLNGVEVVLDEWPWLDPYIEIEGPSIAAVQQVAGQLGYSWGDAVFGDVMVAYRVQYPHLTEKDTVGDIAEVRFGDPLPELFKN